MAVYDLCIVGAGMIGSAAARHASLVQNRTVCLIGPSEPESRSLDNDRDIYGAYYDEGRITRCCDPVVDWAKLAQESIKRYRAIEEQSGINFYHEVGNLSIGSGTDSQYVKSNENAAKSCGVPYNCLNDKVLSSRWPYLELPPDANAILESHNAGFINPRKLVAAQKLLASRQGCTIVDDVVRKVNRIVQSDGVYVMRIETDSGKVFHAKSVLLATGAFTRFREVLPSNVAVEQKISALTVALVEVDVTGGDKALRDLPCILYKGRRHSQWYIPDVLKNEEEIQFYMLPPIKYPNGKYYIKLGFINPNCQQIHTRDEMKQWYAEGDPKYKEDIAKFLKSLFKGIHFKSWYGDNCAITDTPSIRPYIDKVHDQLGVVFGCNGYAAKSSDEIGRLGATMMLTGWNSDIPEDVFRINYCTNSKL
ncbi:hypothetical protein ACF0H5_013611 [Mactra antiquata]